MTENNQSSTYETNRLQKRVQELEELIGNRDDRIIELETEWKNLSNEVHHLREDIGIKETEARRYKDLVEENQKHHDEMINQIKEKAEAMKVRIRSTEDIIKNYADVVESTMKCFRHMEKESLEALESLK